jgi:hypothetical protein
MDDDGGVTGLMTDERLGSSIIHRIHFDKIEDAYQLTKA